MKIVKVVSIVCLFILPVIANAQINDIEVNVSGDSQKLTEVIEHIEEKHGIRFFYKDNWINSISVPGSMSGLKLEEVLGRALKNHGLNFTLFNDAVYITEEPINLVVENSGNFHNSDSDENVNSGKEGREKGIASILDNVTVGKKNSNNKRNANIFGLIKDAYSGEPLIGASLYVEELKTGAVSDANGNYMINLKKGSYTFTYRLIGKEPVQKKVTIYSDGRLNVELQESLIALDEVIVKEDKYNNTKGMQTGFEQITMKELKELPPVAGERDILKASLLLPGVQTVGESAAGYNIRGGGVDQNLFLINNIPIYNTAHMFGFFSAFNSDVIRNFNLYKSNIPVEYGGRISSVFDVQTKNGNNKTFSLKGGISPITANLSVEGPIKKEKSSYILGLRTSYSNWILKRLNDASLRNSSVDFSDVIANFNNIIDDNNSINVFLYASRDKFKIPITATSINSDQEKPYINYQYYNIGSAANWQHYFGNQLYSNLSLIFSNYNLDIDDKQIISNAFKSNHYVQHYELNHKFTYNPNPNNELKFGYSSIYYKLNPGTYNPTTEESNYQGFDMEDESAIETSIYIGDKYDINPKLGIEGGLRYSFYNYLGPKTVYEYANGDSPVTGTVSDTSNFNKLESIKIYSGLDVRFSARYLIDADNSIKLGFNRINQYLFLLSNTIAISPTDKWKLCDSYLKPSVGYQYNIGYYKNITSKNLEFSAELYYKTTSNLKEFRDGAETEKNENLEQELLVGEGRSYGLELMLKKSFGKFNGWVNYTYSKSELKFDGNSKAERINYGKFYPSNSDKPHNFNFTINMKFNRRFSVATNFTYSTGRPTTIPESKFYINGLPRIWYSERNAGRLPNYMRLDVAMNLEGNLLKNKIAHGYWTFAIYNLLSRQNAYSAFYKYENEQLKGYMISIFARPVITLTYNFKLGNYLSN